MHELAETERLLEVVLQQARAARACHVAALHLALGPDSHITQASIQFYWDSLSRGTLAEGARLNFRPAPIEFFCSVCHHPFTSNDPNAACPACGNAEVKRTVGEAFYLEAIDVEST